LPLSNVKDSVMSAQIPAQPAAPPSSEGFVFEDISTKVARHGKSQPDALAVQCGADRIHWGDFDRLVSKIARGLQAMGVGRGSKVAVLARPSIAYVALFIATLRAGGCVVPLSNMASGETLARMINDCDARVLFIDQMMRELVDPIRASLDQIRSDGWIGFDFADGDWQGYDDWLSRIADGPITGDIAADDDFNIIYSSGTTGIPKGIVHSHAMRMATCEGLRPLGFGPGCVSLLSTPLYSNTTLVTMLPTLAHGGACVLMQKFDVVGYLELAAKVGATHTMLVPVQYERLLAHPAFEHSDMRTFQMKLSTSAPLRAAVKRQILDRWPGGLVEFYGLTEGGGSCSLVAHEFPEKLHTVGRPAAGAKIKIIDEEGKEMPPGSVGEIVGRSAVMMTGYHKRADATQAMHWVDELGELYYRTGDMGRIDEDGFLTLLDRKKDMIISGGFNIYPADLEAVLSRHPLVNDVAVIGVPSKEWGETPLALVVLMPNASITPEALLAFANEKLGKTQRISAVEIRSELPRSTIGKVLKKDLRAPYWDGGSLASGGV
jgi:acyl-CoA synthetase (AMP-forming)/AMP-acid ligase II